MIASFYVQIISNTFGVDMSERVFKIGLVGANPEWGWGFRAHVPALADHAGFEIAAVSTTREESARAASVALGGVNWHTNTQALVEDDVDLVVVTVKVPHHAEIIRQAFAAGKHVYCEWPLALNLAEAEQLDALATPAARGFVGLQARADPILRRARQLIAEGAIGQVQAVSGLSQRFKGWDETISAANAYTLDISTGAGMLPVLGGHFLDLLRFLLGELSVSSRQSELLRGELRVAGTGQLVPVSAPDTASVSFRSGGTIGNVLLRDGDPQGGTEIQILGSAGKMLLRSLAVELPAAQQPQMARFRLELESNAIGSFSAESPISGLSDTSRNVAEMYRMLHVDLLDGGQRVPDFAEAVEVHRLLEA